MHGFHGNVNNTIANAPVFANLKPHGLLRLHGQEAQAAPYRWLGLPKQGSSKAGAGFIKKCKQNNSKSKVFLRNRKAGAPLGCLGKQSLALYAGASKLKDRCLVGNEK